MVAMSSPEHSATIPTPTTASAHAVFNPLYFLGSRDDLRKLVIQEREKHRQAINESFSALAQLHALQNSLSPVNSLPAELLGLIFPHLLSQGDLRSKPSNFLGYASQHDSQNGFLVDPPSGHRDIVSVTHVCRYWRAVGIQNPWLWTSLPIHHPAALEVHLTRSKNLPISLSLTRRLSSDVAPTLAPSNHRIRSIYVETTLAVDIELLWDELSLPAPTLEELFIEHLECNSYLDGYDVGRTKRLPPLFNGDVPSLRVLTLRGVPPPFALFPSTLVHLDVGRVRGPLPPLAELLEMLRNCTLLETLNVRGAWEWEDIYVHVLLRNSVALPRLARTYLQLEPPGAHGLFLSSLSLPQHTNVSVVSGVEEHGDFEDALSAITPAHIPPCFKGFRRLHLIWEGTDGRLQAFRHPDAISEPPALDVDCRDPWAQPHPDWAGFFFDWPFDASQIETLVVVHGQATRRPHAAEGGDSAAQEASTFDHWISTFRQLPALKTLRAMGLPKVELVGLLDGLEALGYPVATVCPRLTTLEIFDAQDMSAAWDDLVDVAGRRVPRGTQESTLRRVELFNCQPCEYRNLELFVGEFGVELVVDGEEVVMSALATPSSSSIDFDPWS
ncbi:hypothetical protein V8D89_003526 [Ganoderma adspersum]